MIIDVAGFSGERAAQLVDPQLTTVRQPYEQMGATAVDMLLQTIAGEQVPEHRTELAPRLVVRASTA